MLGPRYQSEAQGLKHRLPAAQTMPGVRARCASRDRAVVSWTFLAVPQAGPQQPAPTPASPRSTCQHSNGSARQPGSRCRTEKRKVGGSRPPLTTSTLSGFRGGIFSFPRVLRSRLPSLRSSSVGYARLPPTLRLSAGGRLPAYRKRWRAIARSTRLSRGDSSVAGVGGHLTQAMTPANAFGQDDQRGRPPDPRR